MYGTFTFSYTPPILPSPEDSRVEMSFSSEADLPTILKHFENFLRANGYPLYFGENLKVSSELNEQPSEEKTFSESLTFFPDNIVDFTMKGI